jgi:hypothetical protein
MGYPLLAAISFFSRLLLFFIRLAGEELEVGHDLIHKVQFKGLLRGEKRLVHFAVSEKLADLFRSKTCALFVQSKTPFRYSLHTLAEILYVTLKLNKVIAYPVLITPDIVDQHSGGGQHQTPPAHLQQINCSRRAIAHSYCVDWGVEHRDEILKLVCRHNVTPGAVHHDGDGIGTGVVEFDELE